MRPIRLTVFPRPETGTSQGHAERHGGGHTSTRSPTSSRTGRPSRQESEFRQSRRASSRPRGAGTSLRINTMHEARRRGEEPAQVSAHHVWLIPDSPPHPREGHRQTPDGTRKSFLLAATTPPLPDFVCLPIRSGCTIISGSREKGKSVDGIYFRSSHGSPFAASWTDQAADGQDVKSGGLRSSRRRKVSGSCVAVAVGERRGVHPSGGAHLAFVLPGGLTPDS